LPFVNYHALKDGASLGNEVNFVRFVVNIIIIEKKGNRTGRPEMSGLRSRLVLG
jgi:hypothetical protein